MPGPFSLGNWGGVVNGASVGWVVGISAVLFLPMRVPVTGANMYVCFSFFFYVIFSIEILIFVCEFVGGGADEL